MVGLYVACGNLGYYLESILFCAFVLTKKTENSFLRNVEPLLRIFF